MNEFTRIPNNFIDDLKLNPYQFQIISIIVRKTDGWCKIEDGISLSQFEKLVTFKKNKIVNTIKELCDLNLIEKTKHYDNNKKTYSYSTYKIHQGVVSENNKGSISDKQGVVSEEDKQKKLTTKETNTNSKPSFKSSSERLFDEYMKSKDNISANETKYISDFLVYRKQLKKAVKTILPLESYWNTLVDLHTKKYDIKKCIEIMKENEWQTIKEEWLKNKGVDIEQSPNVAKGFKYLTNAEVNTYGK